MPNENTPSNDKHDAKDSDTNAQNKDVVHSIKRDSEEHEAENYTNDTNRHPNHLSQFASCISSGGEEDGGVSAKASTLVPTGRK
jgi:hypothetical protein